MNRAARSAAAVAVATTAILVGTGLPAQARDMVVHFDNMEDKHSDPATRFTFESNSPYAGGVMRYVGDGYGTQAYSGIWSANLLNLGAEAGSWASVGKTVTVPYSWTFGTATTCQFSAWMNGPSGNRFIIEALDSARTKYLTSKWVQQPASPTFFQAVTNTFTLPTSGSVFLRVKYLTPSYFSVGTVDDFQLQCTYV